MGRRAGGTGAFDRALTLGAELNGSGWRRPQDAVGLAVGRLSLRRGGRSPSVPGATPRTSAAEEVVEIFYRHTPMDGIEISPFFQAVSHAAGNPSAPTLRFWGMRLKLAF